MLRYCLVLVLFGVTVVTAFSPLSSNWHPTKVEPEPLTDASSAGELLRRDVLVTAAKGLVAASFGTMAFNPKRASAAENLVDFKDELVGFSLKVPSDWEKSVQSLPDRRKIVLYIKPDSNQKTLLFFAYTPVRDDFTSLGSFGSVDEVGQATILPKSTLAGVEGIESQMLSSESKKQAYFFDYVTKVPSQPKTHFQTIFSMLPKIGGGAAGNVLVTITAQTPESEYESLKPLFDEIIDSFKPK